MALSSRSRGTREQWKFGVDNEAETQSIHGYENVFVKVGGLVGSSAPTYTDGDAAVFSFDTSGRVRCILEGATFTVSGSDLEVDVSAFRGTTGVTDRQDAWVYDNDEDLSAVSEKWQGFGGYDETADLFRAFPISTDDAAMPAAPQFVAIGGEYRAAATTYTDGDATILQTDINGNLKVTDPVTTYAEDAAHTSGDDGTFILGIRTDTFGAAANIAGTDADYMGLQMNAKGGLYMDVSSVLGSDMSVTNPMFAQITDGTTGVVVETAGSKKALNVNVTDGTNDMPIMDIEARSGHVKITNGALSAEVGLQSGVTDTVDAEDALFTASLLYGRIDNTDTRPVGMDDTTNRNLHVTHRNGANSMPAMDAVGRAGFIQLTDGTNTMPTMDIVARSGYIIDNDGTNTPVAFFDLDSGVGSEFVKGIGIRTAASGGSVEGVKITDGTNYMNTMDANSRAGFFQVTDGTNELEIATDNVPYKTKGNQLLGVYHSTLPTYGDGDAAILQTDNRGRLISTVELNDYTDDSAEFTVATSKLIAIGGIATTDTVQAGDVGAFKMTTSRELAVSAVQSGVWNIGTVTTLTGITNDVNIADGGNVISVDDAGGSLTVDGTVAATQSGVWNITNISGTISLPTGAATETTLASFVYTEAATDATITGVPILWEDTGDTLRAVSAAKPLPVDITDSTIAVTQSGVWNITTLTGITNDVNIADGGNSITVDDGATTLSVDDGGGALTVDGTVAATQSGVWNIGTVTTLTGITNALPAGTNLIGNFKISDGTETVNVNASNQLEIDITGASSQSSASLTSGKETVAAAGTAEQLNGGVSKAVADGFGTTVKSLIGNAGKVYVGNSGVDNTNGFELNPGESITLHMDDVNKIYIDVDNNGEGATWIVEA